MDWTALLSAGKSILSCLAAQYPNVATLLGGLTTVVGASTLIFRAGSTKTAGAVNALLPPFLANAFSGLGSLAGKFGLNLAPKA